MQHGNIKILVEMVYYTLATLCPIIAGQYLYLDEVYRLGHHLVVAGQHPSARSSYQTLAQVFIVRVLAATKKLVKGAA